MLIRDLEAEANATPRRIVPKNGVLLHQQSRLYHQENPADPSDRSFRTLVGYRKRYCYECHT